MSKDIRSYFNIGAKGKTQQTPQTNVVKRKNTSLFDDDDDDVIPPTPTPKKDDMGKKKKRKMVVASDSDSEEAFVESKKSNKPNNAKTNDATKEKSKIVSKPKVKETKAVDIFGTAPVKRSVATKKSNDTNKSSSSKSSDKTELGIHSDDNFDKTLLQLDDKKDLVVVEEKHTKSSSNDGPNTKLSENAKDKETPKKNKHSSNSTNKINNVSKNIFKASDSSASKSNDKNGTIKIIPNGQIKSTKMESQSPKSSKHSSLDRKKLLSDKTKTNKDFSVFIDDDESVKSKDIEKSQQTIVKKQSDLPPSTPEFNKKSRKRKLSETEKTPEVLDEERFEKKRYTAMLYKNYLNRSGPKNHGSKEVPQGSPDCFKGLAFVTTGVLESFERDEITEIVQRHGGEIKSGLSGKVTHLICGDDAGPAKIAKAEKLGTKILTEDEFLNLIKQRSESSNADDKNTKKSPTSSKKTSKTTEKKQKIDIDQRKSSPTKKASLENSKHKFSRDASDKKLSKTSNHAKETADEVVELKKEITVKVEDEKCDEPAKNTVEASSSSKPTANINMSWVDKYRPTTMKQIIGQHGEASCAAKLHKWLSKWYQNRRAKLPAPNPWSKGDGGYYRAILLSGSPGVGKTTTVSVVCKELGFDTVEFNASDTRSKNLIKEKITELTCTNSLAGYVNGKVGKGAISKKHVIIMDEVDGMAGNEDRGGMQELIALIKHTEVPIICICNDKSSTKMRSLVNYSFDLSFAKPKVDQIKAAMLSICYKEGVKISASSLAELIIGASQDVRQILNLLSMWSADEKNMSADSVSRESKLAKKDIKMGPWSVCRSVFSEEEHKNMSIHDKSDLFFHDYSIAPLFVQQNYLKVSPHCPKNEVLARFAEAADSLSAGDLVESRIRGSMAWGLLPTQAMFSSVIPGTLLSGHVQGVIDFPAWLGQNSRTNKMNRLTQEIYSHARLSTSGSKESIRLDYAAHIRDAVLNPLIEGPDGVQKAVDTLQSYHLLRDDLDSLVELSKWPKQKDKNAMIDSKVKAAMTRKYNKEAVPLPYSQVTIKKSQAGKDSGIGELMDSESVVDLPDDDNDASDLENDAMIKKTKKVSDVSKPEKKSKSKTSTKLTEKGKSKKK